MRVLVADDARTMRAALAHALAFGGHALAGEAASLDEALALYERERPEVVLVDSRLPERGARDAVARLLERFPHARVLVIAALDEVALVRAATALGARGAIRRPLEVADVLDALARVAA